MKQVFIGIFISLSAASIASSATLAFGNTVNSSYGQTDPANDFEAILTTNDNNTITVELENFLVNPTADTEMISGLTFTLDSANPGTSPSPTLTQPGVGYLININKTTKVSTEDTVDTIKDWTLGTPTGTTTTTLDITSIGSGSPDDLVIGPPSSGNLASGIYSNANGSIASHNPDIYESVLFTLNVANVTSATTVTNVTFNVGTLVNQGITSVQIPNAVPEPGTLLLVLAAIPAGVYLQRKRARQGS